MYIYIQGNTKIIEEGRARQTFNSPCFNVQCQDQPLPDNKKQVNTIGSQHHMNTAMNTEYQH